MSIEKNLQFWISPPHSFREKLRLDVIRPKPVSKCAYRFPRSSYDFLSDHPDNYLILDLEAGFDVESRQKPSVLKCCVVGAVRRLLQLVLSAASVLLLLVVVVVVVMDMDIASRIGQFCQGTLDSRFN